MSENLDKSFKDNFLPIQPYLRNLNRIVQIIEMEKELSDDEKKEYFKTLQSQISYFEQTVIVYYMLWEGRSLDTDYLFYTVQPCNLVLTVSIKMTLTNWNS
ncbi:putative phage abortive infection protein [Paenibacillus sp. GbtcB18]|uniref:putative phage abortive infection protein n=1 Tax=Paenibacillus sp. GbtcB18 TaxID=2824763 RepID=UPI001C3076E9|nr:putative phage abortive infection protein [Paenibacillus sp. GbtcB18]